MPALLLACALLLAACTASAPPADDPPATTASEAPPRSAATLADRAAEAGLSADQARRLAGLGVPVAVPVLSEGWALANVDAGVTDSCLFLNRNSHLRPPISVDSESND